jgi:hypothetical protein
MNLNNFTKSIIDFINQYFSSNEGVLVCGSINTRDFNENSDIDLVIISPNYNRVFNEMHELQGIAIHIIVIPFFSLYSILNKSYYTREGVYVTMIANGQIILDKTNKLHQLTKLAKDIQKKGPRPLEPIEINNNRAAITSLILDLKYCSKGIQQVFILNKLYAHILQLEILNSRLWGVNSKYGLRKLLELDPRGTEKFNDSYVQSLTSGDYSSFLDNINSRMIKYGGLLPYYTTNNGIYSLVSEDSITIHLSHKKTSSIVVNTLLSIILIIDSLYLENLKYHFFNISNKRNYYYDLGTYIYIQLDRNRINEIIIPRLNEYLHGNYGILTSSEIVMTFPIEIQPFHSFGHGFNLKLESIFSSLSQLTVQNKIINYDSSQKLNLGLNLMISFGKCSFDNFKSFKRFSKIVTDRWLWQIINSDSRFNLAQISLAKTEAINDLKLSFDKQSLIINGFIEESIVNWEESKQTSSLQNTLNDIFSLFHKNMTENLIALKDTIPEYLIEIQGIALKSDTKYKWYFLEKFLERCFDSLFFNSTERVYLVFLISNSKF